MSRSRKSAQLGQLRALARKVLLLEHHAAGPASEQASEVRVLPGDWIRLVRLARRGMGLCSSGHPPSVCNCAAEAP